MNGCLVRVGIDSTSGGWNAPVNKDNEFDLRNYVQHGEKYNEY